LQNIITPLRCWRTVADGRTHELTACIAVFIQAARDGLLDVVKAHIDSCLGQINDVDDEGYTAMHYAARYNRVSVMEILFAAGAGLLII